MLKSVRLIAVARAAVLGLLGAGLSGCGFTPLYATPGLTPALASIKVDAPQSRTAYLIRQSLDQQLGYDPDTPARYHLTFVNTETRNPAGVTVNNIASRYNINLSVGYTLTDSVTGKVVLSGTVGPVQVTFDATTPPYASVAASQDGEVRAAEQAAIRMRLELARYFNHLAHPLAAPAVLGAQLPPPATEGPVSRPAGPPPIDLPGFSGSNLTPQVIDNPPPPTVPIEATPEPSAAPDASGATSNDTTTPSPDATAVPGSPR